MQVAGFRRPLYSPEATATGPASDDTKKTPTTKSDDPWAIYTERLKQSSGESNGDSISLAAFLALPKEKQEALVKADRERTTRPKAQNPANYAAGTSPQDDNNEVISRPSI